MIGRRLLVWLGVLVVPAVLLLPAIALVTPSADSAAAQTTVGASPLPPADHTDLVAIFDPKVRRFGLRVTRASLVNAKEQRSKSGTHLAIYVEPTGRYTTQDYIDGALKVTRVFLPYVFTRWKGLLSFDVCQEPPPGVDDRLAPAPETQVFATRAGNKRIDWPKVDVADLMHRSNRGGRGRPVPPPTPASRCTSPPTSRTLLSTSTASAWHRSFRPSHRRPRTTAEPGGRRVWRSRGRRSW